MPQKAKSVAPQRVHQYHKRRKNNTKKYAFIGTGIVLVIIIAIVLVSTLGSSPSKTAAAGSGAAPAPASLANQIQSVPMAAQSAVGTGAFNSMLHQHTVIAPARGGQLRVDNKPEIVYVGAEYCPYCAVTRWPLIIALSRFGRFSHLSLTQSSHYDVYPNTHTWSFFGSTYVSEHLFFRPIELTTNQCIQLNGSQCYKYKALQNPSKATMRLLRANGDGQVGIPFLDFAGQWKEAGPVLNPALIKGMNWSQIMNSINDPSSIKGQGILEAANIYTAMLCQLTHDRPGSVCSSAGLRAATKALG